MENKTTAKLVEDSTITTKTSSIQNKETNNTPPVDTLSSASPTLSASVLAAIDSIVKIACEFQENEASELTTAQVKILQQNLSKCAVSQSFKEALALLAQKLKDKGFTVDKLAEQKSAKTCLNLLNQSITSSKKGTAATDLLPAVDKVTCPYFEKTSYNYFTVTTKGDVVCLLPFMSCTDNMSAENTCKVGQTMKQALLGAAGKGPEILEVINTYLSDLIQDFQLLGFFEGTKVKDAGGLESYCGMQIKSGSTAPAIQQAKAKRYLQLKRYQILLMQVLSDQDLKRDLGAAGNFMSKFPQPIESVLKKSNAVSFLIAPQTKEQDNFLRLGAATLFSLPRKNISSHNPNPEYPNSFPNKLSDMLTALSGTKLTQKKVRKTITAQKLVEAIEAEYRTLAKKHREQIEKEKKKTDGDKTKSNAVSTTASPQTADTELLVQDSEEFGYVRQAILAVLKTLELEDYAKLEEDINKFAHWDREQKRYINTNEDLWAYVEAILCDTPSFTNCLDVLLNEDSIDHLIKETSLSPFDEPRVTDPAFYNELIQNFLALACVYHLDYAHSQGLEGERTNFGIEIEKQEPNGSIFNAFFTSKKHASLIADIKKAIEKKLSLEDTMLEWLEKHILVSQKAEKLRTFTSETKGKIKNLFRAYFDTAYHPNPSEAAPHVDDGMVVVCNQSGKSPQVVLYRGTMAIPLDVFCENFTTKPWLKENFDHNKNAHLVPLPKASDLTLEEGITVPSTASVFAGCEPINIEVMKHLMPLMLNDPKAAAETLLHKTTAGKTIYSLLNANQVDALMQHKNWSTVSIQALATLTKVSLEGANAFKKKFHIQKVFSIPRDLEQALYDAYIQLSTRTHWTAFDQLGKDENRMKTVLENVISHKEKENGIGKGKGKGKGKEITAQSIVVTKTLYGTYSAELSIEQLNVIKQIHADHKKHLYVSPDMASGLYKQVGEGAEIEKTHSRHADILKMDSKLPLTLRALFPDLTIGVSNTAYVKETLPNGIVTDVQKATITGLPEGKQATDPDVIIVELNPQNTYCGYQINSSNPDNLHRIRDCYESSLIHTLTLLEAGKIIEQAINKSSKKAQTSVDLDALGDALETLKISYNSLVEVNGVYQISCSDQQWEKIVEHKRKVQTLDANKVTLNVPVVNSTIVELFFAAISKADISEAHRLLLAHPALLNTKDPRVNPNSTKKEKFDSTPLISALAIAGNPKTSSEDRTKLLDFCLYLIGQPAIELTHRDARGNTALHRAVYYSSPYYFENYLISQPLKDEFLKFEKISLTIFEKARKEGTEQDLWTMENSGKETIFGAPCELIFDKKNKIDKGRWENSSEIKDRTNLETKKRGYSFDINNRMRFRFVEESIWNLYAETRYYKVQPVIDYLAKLSQADSLIKANLIAFYNKPHPDTQKTLLEWAIERGDKKGVDALLKWGADPLTKTADGNQTLIQLAIALHAQQTEKFLIGEFDSLVKTFFYSHNEKTVSENDIFLESVLLEWIIRQGYLGLIDTIFKRKNVTFNTRTPDGTQTFGELAMTLCECDPKNEGGNFKGIQNDYIQHSKPESFPKLLERFIRNGNFYGVEQLIKLKRPDLNAKTSDGKQTLIQLAIAQYKAQKTPKGKERFKETIETFIKQDLNAEDRKAILQWAIESGHAYTVEKLPWKNVVSGPEQIKYTQLAIEHYWKQTDEKAKDAFANMVWAFFSEDTRQKGNVDSYPSLLEWAIRIGDASKVQALIKCNANTNAKISDGSKTLIQFAIAQYESQTDEKVKNNFYAVINALSYTQSNLEWDDYKALLEWAIRAGDDTTAGRVLSNKHQHLNTDAKADYNLKMLTLAFNLWEQETDSDKKAVFSKILFKFTAGHSYAPTKDQRQVLLEWAIKKGDSDRISSLCSAGIDLSKPTLDGKQTLIELAFSYQNKTTDGKEVVKLLLRETDSLFLDLLEQKKALTEKIVLLEQEKEELFKQNPAVAKQYETKDLATQENTTLNKICAELTQKNQDLKKINQELKKENQKLEEGNQLNATANQKLQEEKKELEATKKNLTEETTQLQKTTQKAQSDLLEAKTALEKTQHELEKERSQLDNAQIQVDGVKQAKKLLDEDLKTCEEKKKTVKEERKEALEELKVEEQLLYKTREELELAQKSHKEKKKGLEQTQKAHLKIEQNLKQVTEDKTKQNEICQTLQQELQLLEQQNNSIREGIKKTQTENKALEKQLEEETQKNAQYESLKALNNLKSEAEKDKASINKLEKQIAEKNRSLEENLNSAKQEAAEIQKNLTTASNTLQNLENLPYIKLRKEIEGLQLSKNPPPDSSDLEQKLTAFKDALLVALEHGVDHYEKIKQAIDATKALIQNAIVPFKLQKNIDLNAIQKAINAYDTAVVSLSSNQKIGVAGAALLGAVLGMIAGFLIGFAVGAALTPDVTSVSSAFRDLFSAAISHLFQSHSIILGTAIGTTTGGIIGLTGAGFTAKFGFFKTDPIKPQAQDLLLATDQYVNTIRT